MNQKQKFASKSKKKSVLKVGIESRMVNSLQLMELCVQNTSAVYPWFLESIFN